MRAITLAPAKAEDAPSLASLRVAAMRPSLEAVGRFDAERARARFIDTFDPRATWYVVHEGQRVGVLVVRQQTEGLLLDHLYIEPAVQGQALGASVLQQVFAMAKKLRCVVHVGALKGSRSNAFYLRHGFKLDRVGEWDNYYIWAHASDA
jgi:GNAT superfamily N-acetyltransferase